LNITLGKVGSIITGIAVLAFAISMIITESVFLACLLSMFIAIGFKPFMCAIFGCEYDALYKRALILLQKVKE